MALSSTCNDGVSFLPQGRQPRIFLNYSLLLGGRPEDLYLLWILKKKASPGLQALLHCDWELWCALLMFLPWGSWRGLSKVALTGQVGAGGAAPLQARLHIPNVNTFTEVGLPECRWDFKVLPTRPASIELWFQTILLVGCYCQVIEWFAMWSGNHYFIYLFIFYDGI